MRAEDAKKKRCVVPLAGFCIAEECMGWDDYPKFAKKDICAEKGEPEIPDGWEKFGVPHGHPRVLTVCRYISVGEGDCGMKPVCNCET